MRAWTKLLLSVSLALSWVAPLCAQGVAPSHACCMGGAAPKPAPSNRQLPACCRASDAMPVFAAVTAPAPVPALLSSAVIAAEPPRVCEVVLQRFVAAFPQAPPGTHSGLSPPASV